MLKEVHVRINKNCPHALLMVGVTGEGKSTICSHFGGYNLIVKMNKEKEEVYIDHKDPKNKGP